MKRWTIPLLMLVAVALRLREYLANRSLWVDEAMLSLNIVHRDFAQLWHPLGYHQGAPVGFLMIERLSIRMFGNTEYVLRLFPLLAGIASIFLFYLLAKRFLSGAVLPLALALFAISPSLIYYASEVKQYSSDVAIALLLLYLASADRVLLLGILGAIAIWFSHPAVFVMAGICTLLLLRDWRNWKSLLAIALSGSSVAFCYVVLLRPLSHDTSLLAYWQQYFIPFPSNPKWLVDTFFDMFRNSAALAFTGLAAFGFFCGGISLWKRNRATLLLLLSPAMVTLLAAAVHKYPFGGRLILFFVPVVLLLIAEGAEVIRVVAGNKFGVILLTLLLIDPGLYTLHRFISPLNATSRAGVMPLEETRPLLSKLKASLQPGDVVYVYNPAMPSFEYYAERTGFPRDNVVFGTAGGDDPQQYEKDFARFTGKHVWLVLSHMTGTASAEPGYLRFYMSLRGTRLQTLTFPGAEADYYNMQR
jgi:hypothetical protein